MLFKMLAKARGEQKAKFNGAPCAYFDGLFNYFNSNAEAYHAQNASRTWNGPCASEIKYDIDMKGSIAQYRILLARLSVVKYQIVLFSGDWDDVVPYHDTVKGIRNLLHL